MKDKAVKLNDFLVEYNSTIGSVPDKNHLPFQIVLSKEIQERIAVAVADSRSGNEWAAKLVFSDHKDAADLIDWVEGKRHSATISTSVTADYHYRGTFHTHPSENELEVFRGMGYPPSATDINNLVNIKQNLICIVVADDRARPDPEIYLTVKTKQSMNTVDDDAMEKLVTAKVRTIEPPKQDLYRVASRVYGEVVLDLCTQAFVGYYWGYLTSAFDGAIILQNFGP